jgi:N-acetylmuramoyl-L-alanine amidase
MENKIRICIDPGHGMSNRIYGIYDPGITRGEYSEAKIVMEYALSLKFHLTHRGVPVYLIRKNAADHAPLNTRPLRAESNGCTHYISLHLNGGGRITANGTETFYRTSESRNLAEQLQLTTVRVFNFTNRGVKTEGELPLLPDGSKRRLRVLDAAMPAALLEIGFLPNSHNIRRIVSAPNRRFWAETMANDLIQAWKEKLI